MCLVAIQFCESSSCGITQAPEPTDIFKYMMTMMEKKKMIMIMLLMMMMMMMMMMMLMLLMMMMMMMMMMMLLVHMINVQPGNKRSGTRNILESLLTTSSTTEGFFSLELGNEVVFIS